MRHLARVTQTGLRRAIPTRFSMFSKFRSGQFQTSDKFEGHIADDIGSKRAVMLDTTTGAYQLSLEYQQLVGRGENLTRGHLDYYLDVACFEGHLNQALGCVSAMRAEGFTLSSRNYIALMFCYKLGTSYSLMLKDYDDIMSRPEVWSSELLSSLIGILRAAHSERYPCRDRLFAVYDQIREKRFAITAEVLSGVAAMHALDKNLEEVLKVWETALSQPDPTAVLTKDFVDLIGAAIWKLGSPEDVERFVTGVTSCGAATASVLLLAAAVQRNHTHPHDAACRDAADRVLNTFDAAAESHKRAYAACSIPQKSAENFEELSFARRPELGPATKEDLTQESRSRWHFYSNAPKAETFSILRGEVHPTSEDHTAVKREEAIDYDLWISKLREEHAQCVEQNAAYVAEYKQNPPTPAPAPMKAVKTSRS